MVYPGAVAGRIGEVTTYEYDAPNRPTTVWIYSYNLMGNMTEKARYKVEKKRLDEIQETKNEGNTSSNNADESNEGIKFSYATKILSFCRNQFLAEGNLKEEQGEL